MSDFVCATMQAPSGDVAVVRPGGGAAFAMLAPRPGLIGDVPLILCRPASDNSRGILIAADAGHFAVEGDPYVGPANAVGLQIDEDTKRADIHHCMNNLLRVCLPDPAADGTRAGKLNFRPRRPHLAHGLVLQPCVPEHMPSEALRLVDEIATGVTENASWQALICHLRDGKLRPALVETLLLMLPQAQLAALALHLLDNLENLALLQAALPDNPWLKKRFSRLAAWHGSDRLENPCARGAVRLPVAETADLPGVNGTPSHRLNVGLALTALARRQIAPRRTACILASARNEGAYLLEWIAYHRSIGFDGVFLYTNDNTDGSDALLYLLAHAGEIHWTDSQSGPTVLPQYKAFGHGLSVLPQILDYRWTLICDIDEYLGFNTGKFASLAEFLAWQEERRSDAVALPWLIYVSGAYETWKDSPSVERFPRREVAVNHHIKTLFRTNLMWCANPHYPEPTLKMWMKFMAEWGDAHRSPPPHHNPAFSANPLARHAWIAHYMYRTGPELLMKIVRGGGDSSCRQWDRATLLNKARHFARMASGPLVTDMRTQSCGAGAQAELARLRAIPGVAACEVAIKRNFQSEMRAAIDLVLAENFDDREFAAFRDMIRMKVPA